MTSRAVGVASRAVGGVAGRGVAGGGVAGGAVRGGAAMGVAGRGVAGDAVGGGGGALVLGAGGDLPAVAVVGGERQVGVEVPRPQVERAVGMFQNLEHKTRLRLDTPVTVCALYVCLLCGRRVTGPIRTTVGEEG